MIKNGHVIVDMLLFLAHTWFAWSLVFVGMVNSNSSTTHLPPLHGDEEQESRTTLFKGSKDDVVQPALSNPTHPMSSSNSKVNSFLYENPFRAPLDGILRDHLPLDYARFHTTSTDVKGDAEEAQDSRSSKAHAWKRRRKRQDDEEEEVGKICLAGPQPGSAGSQAGYPAEAAGPQPGLQPGPQPGSQPGSAGSQTGYPASTPFCTTTINRPFPSRSRVIL